jgi:4-hydroxythreonine-4-phosphate dehydrogenase
LIGISVGDPAGIGPEITAKALSLREIHDICRPLAVAETAMMEDAVKFSGLDAEIHGVSSPGEGVYELGIIDVLDMRNIDAKSIPST